MPLRRRSRTRFGVLMYLGLPPPSTCPPSSFLSSSTVCPLAQPACLVSYRRHPWDSKSVAVSVAVDFIWGDVKPESFTSSCDDVIGSRDAIVDCSEFEMVLVSTLHRSCYLDCFACPSPPAHTRGVFVWQLTVRSCRMRQQLDPTQR